MNELQERKYRITPGRALRRPKVRAILVFLAGREETPREIALAVHASRWYVYAVLRGLVASELVERLPEEGTFSAYTASEKAVKLMQEKRVL